jgi:hypothetical protein
LAPELPWELKLPLQGEQREKRSSRRWRKQGGHSTMWQKPREEHVLGGHCWVGL